VVFSKSDKKSAPSSAQSTHSSSSLKPHSRIEMQSARGLRPGVQVATVTNNRSLEQGARSMENQTCSWREKTMDVYARYPELVDWGGTWQVVIVIIAVGKCAHSQTPAQTAANPILRRIMAPLMSPANLARMRVTAGLPPARPRRMPLT